LNGGTEHQEKIVFFFFKTTVPQTDLWIILNTPTVVCVDFETFAGILFLPRLTLYLFDFLLVMDGCSLIDDCCQISM